MNPRRISEQNRADVIRFLVEYWYTTVMVLRGEVVDLADAEGYVLYDGEEIVGTVTFRVEGEECEILSLNSARSGAGVGTLLIDTVADHAREEKCRILKLLTTNDNIEAIRFYQKRGFDMARINHDALKVSRRLKPMIPEIGEHGIPLRHEIEFVMQL